MTVAVSVCSPGAPLSRRRQCVATSTRRCGGSGSYRWRWTRGTKWRSAPRARSDLPAPRACAWRPSPRTTPAPAIRVLRSRPPWATSSPW